MSSSLRRGVAAAFFAFSIAGLSACGAGNDAATSEITPNVASARVDDIRVQNVNIIVPQDSSGDPGAVIGHIFNGGDHDQTLEAIELPGSGSRVELSPAEGEGSLVVPAHGSLLLGGEGNASAVVADPESGDIALGNAQQVVFVLSETGDIELRAPVVDDSDVLGDFSRWGATPTPSVTEGSEGDEGGADAGTTGEPGQPGSAEGAEGTTQGREDGQEDGREDDQEDEGAAGTEGATGGGPAGTTDVGAAEGTGTEGEQDASQG